MKTTNKLKIAAFAAVMLFAGAANAQTTAGASTSIGKQAAAALDSDTGSVRVIDNKGTKKYLQSNNGITMFTDTNTAGGIVTTWQLGGTLTANTDIATASGTALTISGGEFILADTEVASGSATTAATTATLDTSGFTVLVRNEETGEIVKMLASSLITAGQQPFIATASQSVYTLTGAVDLASFEKVWVYRNGAKLVADVDYSVSGAVVTLDTTGGTTAGYMDADWAVYAGDIIEVQFVK